jgi:hypothetical protein
MNREEEEEEEEEVAGRGSGSVSIGSPFHGGKHRQERAAEAFHGATPNGSGELHFELAQNREPVEKARLSVIGEDHPARARIIGIVHACHNALRFETVEQLGHRLLGDSQAQRKICDSCSSKIDVRKERCMRSTEASVA